MAELTSWMKLRWWLTPDFRGVGFMGAIDIYRKYHGTWNQHQDFRGGRLTVGQSGLVFRGAVKPYEPTFVMPWSDVAAIHIEGTAQVSQRITATRIAAVGLFALAAPKKTKSEQTFITVDLHSGDEFVFEPDSCPREKLVRKLTPVVKRLRRAAELRQTIAGTPAPPPAPPAPPATTPSPSVADELLKWVQLRDVDAITQEQFAEQREKLLSNNSSQPGA